MLCTFFVPKIVVWLVAQMGVNVYSNYTLCLIFLSGLSLCEACSPVLSGPSFHREPPDMMSASDGGRGVMEKRRK